MANTKSASEYAIYWKVWGVLLLLTVTMIFVDQAAIPRTALILVLIAAMLTKTVLISGWFMHLRHEHRALGLGLFVGLVVTGVVLFVLILPDAGRILEQTSQ